jgi:hypothetical protein
MNIQEDTPMTKEEAMMLTIQHRLEDTAYEIDTKDTVRKIELQVMEAVFSADDDGNDLQIAKKIKVLSVDGVSVASEAVDKFVNELLDYKTFTLYLK